ncbi:DUF6265 family protein [Flavobacterium sp.]|uniref:DUF6265 family protein n=1 Tax=Flavobacterium sp. TaxID=239 RepID=UPI0012017B79|nr:DUF6265 family protein [Flavobacterium sp.]RZJ69077.1 MAG: hypothetical protein EOO49_18705 [Flavobacterium sp.]
MKKITLFFVLTILASCSDKANLTDANWLVGNWKQKLKGAEMTETWSVESDSALIAKSFVITTENDTVFAEHVRLVQRHGNLIYIVTAIGQNDDKPVEFALTSKSDKRFVFENPEHDYPSKIVYENYGDSLKATISGLKDGAEMSEDFPMKKVK